MNESKDIVVSKSFWGAVVLLVSMLLSNFDINIDAEGWTNAIMGLVGAVLVVVGRIKANKRIASFFGFKLEE